MYVWSNIHQKSVTSFMDAPYVSLILRLFVYGVQHLEHCTGCLKPSVAFLTGDHKSGLTVHKCFLYLGNGW